MRTEADLQGAFDLLERQAQAYLAEAVPTTSDLSSSTSIDLGTDRLFSKRMTSRRVRVAVPLLAATVVASTAVGIALYNGNGAGRTPAALDGATPICTTTLPATWQTALHARQTTVNGQWLQPITVTAKGAVIADWYSTDGSLRLGTVSPQGAVRELFRQPVKDDQQVARVTADGTSAVVELMPKGNGAQPVAVSDIVLVDLATGRAEHLLAKAPIPHGYVSSGGGGSWAVIQDGVFYWLAGPQYDNAPQTLMSYNIAEKRYGARPTGQAAVYWNPLGISWSDGAVPVHDRPPVLPPSGQHQMTVAYDGSSVAWSLYGSPSLVHWSDRSGVVRELSQQLMSQLTVEAVAGSFVLLTSGEGADSDRVAGDVQILDTRTGALADTGLDGWQASGSADGTVALSPNASPSQPLLVLDTTNLPELTCSVK